MSVVLNPGGQLGFQRPLTSLVKKTLSVSNNNSQPIAFKVKTTAPKQYCVRPNSGRIEPGETVEVQVLLQPMKEDPLPGTKCRDKFLVQSVLITPERETSPLTDLWIAVEREDKLLGDKEQALIYEQKIRCAYLPAAEDSTVPEETQSARSSSISKHVDNSTSPTNGADSSFSTFSPTVESASPAASTPSRMTPPTYETLSTPTPASSLPSITPTAAEIPQPVARSAEVTSTQVETKNESAAPLLKQEQEHLEALASLQAQLSSAQSQIVKLKAELQQSESLASGLRNRSVASSAPVSDVGKSNQVLVASKSQSGAPVPVVAGLVVGVFVLTWLLL